jgi:hypothetical protein
MQKNKIRKFSLNEESRFFCNPGYTLLIRILLWPKLRNSFYAFEKIFRFLVKTGIVFVEKRSIV